MTRNELLLLEIQIQARKEYKTVSANFKTSLFGCFYIKIKNNIF